MLSTAAVKAARPKARAYKLFDERGLHLFVAPTGLKSWRLKYRSGGREQLLVLGRFPDLQLGEARARAEAARVTIETGGNPRLTSAPVHEALCFADLARRWHAANIARWSPAHAEDVLSSLERDVFPAIGALELAAIGGAAVLKLLRTVERRGCIETARRLRQRISDIFRYAIAEELADADPAALVGKALAPAPLVNQQAALTDPAELRALLTDIDAAPARAATKLAVRFLALTAVRRDAITGARWDEIEGVDWTSDAACPAALWRVPPARMKLSRAKKGSARFEHLVPLSGQAVAVLRAARALTCGPFIFPGRSAERPISGRAIAELHVAAGYAGRHVPHGWRAAFSTVLNERFPELRAAIDLALGHAPKDKVEAAYNRAQQLERRRALFEAWADEILPPIAP